MTYRCANCQRTYERSLPLGLDDYCPVCSNPAEGLWQMLRPDCSDDIDLTWHSTPQLWIAMRHGVCCCPECKPPFGMGKTKEEAVASLREWEADCSNGDGE